jgi:hypothetical protein
MASRMMKCTAEKRLEMNMSKCTEFRRPEKTMKEWCKKSAWSAIKPDYPSIDNAWEIDYSECYDNRALSYYFV